MDKIYAVNKLKTFLDIVGDDFDLKEEILEAIDLLSSGEESSGKNLPFGIRKLFNYEICFV